METRSWDIIGRRRWGYALSLLIILPGLVALLTRGLNLGIDFTGGTLLDVRLGRDAPLAEVRTTLQAFGLADAIIQKSPDRPRQVLIRTPPLDEATTARVTATLARHFGGAEVLLAERVGPTVGRELRTRAMVAVVLGLLLQVVYISWRFRSVRFAVTADIALVHDLLVVVGLYALLGIQVDSSFVAVLLTVVGYSINDTVVIFDRIRESQAAFRGRTPFDRLVNRSILEVLVRSLTTGLGALMAIGAIYFLGGVTLRDFAFGLGVGILTGTYSSIFVASPLLVEWERWTARARGPQPAAAARPAGTKRISPSGSKRTLP
ncbi:MAG: protein translocase subunit SecF [Armatimonadota bacterium]|nr:protein translocase subunit SecF [Armatimonadota bacterium]MDR7403871.1 protein translocase subunit SecF [Armatimonadota bacterium]